MKRFSLIIMLSCLYSLISPIAQSKADDLYPYITSSLPIDGLVAKLAIPKSKPNLLFALVEKDKDPEKNGGLYIFDISSGNSPKLLSHYYLNSSNDFVISPDGNTVLLQNRHFINSSATEWYGVVQLDISNPGNILENGKIAGEIFCISLSADGKYLYTSPMGGTFQPPSFHVFKLIKGGNPQEVGGASAKPPQMTSRMFPIQDGKQLVVDTVNGLLTFDISNPSAPIQVASSAKQYGNLLAVRGDGTEYSVRDNDLIVASGYPDNLKLGDVQEKINWPHDGVLSEDGSRLFVIGYDQILHVFDVKDSKAPRANSQYAVPRALGAVVPSFSDNLIYVGLNGSIVTINPVQAIISANQLLAAYSGALRQYHRRDLKQEHQRADAANSILKASGIERVVDKKVAGLPDSKMAEILNDYAFFLERSLYPDDKQSISIFKRVIQLDPERSVAYLNLGDSLRRQLPSVNSFQEKINLSKEVKAAYARYTQLAGRSTSDTDNFMALNLVDSPITNFCEYVSTYNSHERLKEIFGLGESVPEAGGQANMRIETGYEGTAHIPSVSLIDVATQQDITETDSDVTAAYANDDTRAAQNIRAVPFYDGYYLLYYDGALVSFPNSGVLIKSFPVGGAKSKGKTCSFR